MPNHSKDLNTLVNFRKIESPGSSKDEVVVYGEQERPKEVIPLKKSVKAQVHSLEARGRGPPVKKNQHAVSSHDLLKIAIFRDVLTSLFAKINISGEKNFYIEGPKAL